EVRAVRRQITQPYSIFGKQLADPLDLVCGQVIQDQRVAWMQTRAEHLLEINRKNLCINGTIHQKGSFNLFMAQRGNESGALPMSVRNNTQTALAPQTTAIQTGQLGVQ